MNQIKVLHVAGQMDRGGTEALLMSLLRTVDKQQFSFDFVEQTEKNCDYDNEILSLGSKIYGCPHISASNVKQYRKWWRQFFKDHPEYKIIHGHSRGSAPIYLDEANKAGRVTILHCHNNSHGKGIKGFIRFIWQLPLRKMADYNFACSYDSGVSQFGKNSDFTVIKNGINAIDYDWDANVRRKTRNEMALSDKFVVGNVARFVEQKNHLFLIEVFKAICDIKDNAVLLLIGEGPKENEIKEKIRDYGLEDKVIFTGVRSDVNKLYLAMDVFVLPSLFEGFGIVNIEAQTSGLPCFVSEKVVPQEVNVTDAIHYISLKRSADYWAKVILDNTISERNRSSKVADIIAHGYDISSTLEFLTDFYTEVSGDEH